VLTLVSSALAAAALSVAGTTSAPLPAQWATLAFSRTGVAGSGVYLAGRGKLRVLAADAFDPAWSPDGRRLAYVAPGAGGTSDLYVADADGTHVGRLTRSDGIDETSPSWSPNGTRLVVERAGRVVVLRADGSADRPLAVGTEPAWSPDGTRIAFTDGDDVFLASVRGGKVRRLISAAGSQTSPAWSPDGRRLAYVSDEAAVTDVYVLRLRDATIRRLTADEAFETSPAFTANGRGVVFASSRTGVETLWRVPARGGTAVPLFGAELGSEPATRPEPRAVELLPDLEQRPPADLSIKTVRRGGRPRFVLGFDSATDNVGLGPVIITARRRDRRTPFMRAAQVVKLDRGGRRTLPRASVLRYVYSPTHSHWHVMGFQRYELRRATDDTVVLRDRKSGFCLADHWAHAPGHLPNEPPGPVFKGYCEQGRPDALAVYQGTSVGYTDRYPSHFHGQNLDLTRLAAGTYVLVHRANRSMLFRELRYENNAGSVRIRLTWPRGRSSRPSVRILRTCPDSDRCP
jgi:WD40-like Beta Propeller Repeat/Lysyl oxidase